LLQSNTSLLQISCKFEFFNCTSHPPFPRLAHGTRLWQLGTTSDTRSRNHVLMGIGFGRGLTQQSLARTDEAYKGLLTVRGRSFGVMTRPRCAACWTLRCPLVSVPAKKFRVCLLRRRDEVPATSFRCSSAAVVGWIRHGVQRSPVH